jgi:hypothetical protein
MRGNAGPSALSLCVALVLGASGGGGRAEGTAPVFSECDGEAVRLRGRW